jgi:3-hydroxyisobutyrate dehydrogenase
MLRTGFIGLGDMGGRMALRLCDAGFALTVHDRRQAAAAAVRAAGATVAGSASAVVQSSDVTGICVVDEHQLRSVVDDALGELRPGKVLLVHSSVTPDVVRDLDTRVRATGAALVDAPVSGSRPAADAGELTVLAGGCDADLATVDSVLRAFASTVLHTGAVGTGQAMKLTNNVMLHMNHLVVLEALRFAKAQGLTEESVLEAVNISSGRSWVTETWGLIDDMLIDHPQAGTSAIYAMMSKDLWQSVAVARADLTDMSLTALGTQLSRRYFEEREADLAG